MWKKNHLRYVWSIDDIGWELSTTKNWLEWTNNHQCTSWGWGHSSHFGDEPKTHPPLPKVFGFFSLFYAPSFSLLPTSFLFTSPLLPTSPHFAFIPSLELGSTWSGTHEFHCQNLGMLETRVRIMSLKRDPWQHAYNKTQDNALQVGAITNRLELELEDKFSPLSPFIFGYVTTKKVMTIVVITFFYLRKRRWRQQWAIIFLCGSMSTKRWWW